MEEIRMQCKTGLYVGLVICGIFAATLPAHAAISVGTGLPGAAVVSNPAGSSGTSTVGSGTTPVKGNSFVLAADSSLTSVSFLISSITDVAGSITLDFYNLTGTPDSTAGTGQVPTGASFFTQTEVLPTVAAGDYVTIILDTPLALAAGNYAFAISTSDADFNVALNSDNAYTEGELVRQYIATGVWQDRANDMVFAIEGAGGTPFILGNPAVWPTTFLENAPQSTADSIGVSSGMPAIQPFTLAGNSEVDTVLVQLDDGAASSDTDGSLTLEIFAADGSGLPIGTALATLAGELPEGLATSSFIEFDFPGTVALSPGDYALALTTSDTDLLLNATADDLVFGLTDTFTPPVVRPPAASGPNILFILADDLSWVDLETGKPNLGNGSDFHRTPNINRLADEGVSFTYCFVHQNCAPTRAALLSGQYPARSGNGVYNVDSLNRGTNSAVPPPALTPPGQNEDVPAAHYTMAEMLWDAGYVTCHVGKYHVGGHEGGAATLPENQSFDYNFGGDAAGSPGSFFASSSGVFQKPSHTIDPFGAPYAVLYINDILSPVANGNNPATLDGTNKHLSDAEGDAVIHFLDEHRGGALSNYPFYVQYHSYAVHSPIQPRPDLKTKYDGLPLGVRHDRADYAGLVEGLDQTVGRILNYLDATGLANDTLVIFLSDNGGSETQTENAPLRSRKGSIYNGGIRVPLIVRQPGSVPADRITDTMVHAVDLFPTLMQAAGGSTTEILDGTSFYSHVLDPVANPRNRVPIFYHFPGYMDNRIRPCEVVIKDVGGKRYKLIYTYDYVYDPNTTDDGIMVLSQPWELYNITDDLSETTNLIDGTYWSDLLYGDIADELAVDLAAWLTQSDPTWNAVKMTRKSDGSIVDYPPADVPDVMVPEEQIFRVTNVIRDEPKGKVTVSFVSVAGLVFDVQASPSLPDSGSWTTITNGIPGQAGTTTVSDISDPPVATATQRFYRAVVRP